MNMIGVEQTTLRMIAGTGRIGIVAKAANIRVTALMMDLGK